MRTTHKLAILLTAALALLAAGGSFAIAERPAPLARLVRGAAPLERVPVLTLTPLDAWQALAASQRTQGSGPLQFAESERIFATPATHGLWETLPGGTQLWRLRVASQGALSLNFGFTRYTMPAGGRLTVYDINQAMIYGPYTDADNEAHGQLWTPIVPGDEAVVEVELPAGTPRDQLQLVLTKVGRAFLDPFSPEAEKGFSGSCNVDVVCPQAAAWQAQIRSVALMVMGGTRRCTGALINNTAQDKRPLFLTANHCVDSDEVAASVVTYWNYYNPTCRIPGSLVSGLGGSGSLRQTLSGAFLRATFAPSDMTLLELDDMVPDEYNPYWAGWDRGPEAPSRAVAIHHPRGAEKRISFENDPTTITGLFSTESPGPGTHIRVTDWDLGTTESGSSGSPLFNQNGLVVGQLHGGDAACGNDGSDWYGRLHMSWAGGGVPGTRLSDFLDPIGSGVTWLPGLDGTSLPVTLTPYSYIPSVER